MMIPSMNHINRVVESTHSDIPKIKNNDFCRRRCSSLPNEQNYLRAEQQDDNNLTKRSQEEQSSLTNDSKSKAQDRQIGEADKEDEKVQQYRAAVDSLGPYDVICGRGSLAFNNIGNRRFRFLMTMNVDKYNNSQGRHRKGLFIGSLVDTLQHQVGVRFFKLKGGQLIELTERQIRQKVGHALRDVLAFQESQAKQHQQIRKQKGHERFEFNPCNTQPATPVAKPSPSKTGPAPSQSRFSPSEATLSSTQSRLREMRPKNEDYRLQRQRVPPPSPFGHISFNTSRNTSNGLSKLPSAANSAEELRKDSGSKSTAVLCHGYIERNESLRQPSFTWSRSANAIFRSSNSHKYIINSNDSHTYDPNNNPNNNKSFARQQERDISETFADMDLAPIPLDEHQEPDDDAIQFVRF